MPTVYGILYSTLKSLMHVILCKYRHDQFGESIQCPCKTFIEFVHDKTNKMTCVSSEDSDQPVHPLESSLCAQWVVKDRTFLHADSEDSDQTGRTPRLI